MPDSDSQALLRNARRMFDAGKLRTAAKLCREYLNIDAKNVEALDLFGAILIKAGLNEKAVNVLEESMLLGGPNSAVLYNYGVALRGVGQLVQASRAFKNAAIADPSQADCWFNLGETYRRLEYHSKAISALKKAIQLNGSDASYIFTLGNAFLDGDHFNEAVDAFQSALVLEPNNIEYKNNLGVALKKVGKLYEAIQIFEDILELDSKNAAAQNNLGLILTELNKTSEAEEAYLSALDIAPNYSAASLNLADLYFQMAEFENAMLCLNKAMVQDKENASLLIKLSLVLQKQGLLEEARTILTDSSIIADTKTSISTALANILRDIGDFEGAIKILGSLSSQDPGYPTKHANLGLIYQHQGELLKAEKFFRKALEKKPNNVPLHINLAHTLLSGGQYEEGWKEFRWRQGQPKRSHYLSSLPGDQWEGCDLNGKSILAACEQGAGDCFQFVRFLPLLIETAREVILSVPPSLYQIFNESFDACKIISMEEKQPKTDFHVLLMDLPYLLGITNIPANVPYLGVRQELIKNWGKRLPVEKVKVGLSWQGNPKYETDYLRSIPFSELTPLIKSGLADFVVIQKGHHAEQIPTMTGLLNLGPELDKIHGFVDTAAVMINLDLIITSDTAVAHLAGALAKPVWLLLNTASDWRWQLERTDTPWYPTMRLFRQPAPRDWPSVIASVETALKNFKK